MRRSMLALALTLGLGACATPYTDLIDHDEAACKSGTQSACDALPTLQEKDAIFREDRANRVAVGLAAGLAGAAAVYAASHPPPPPPVYYAPVVAVPVTCCYY